MNSVTNCLHTDELIYTHFRKLFPSINVVDMGNDRGKPATWAKMRDMVASHIKEISTEATLFRENASKGHTKDNTVLVCYTIAATIEIARRKEIVGYEPQSVVTVSDFLEGM